MKKKLFLALSSLLMLPTVSLASDILSVHILDQRTGTPAGNVNVILEQKTEMGWVQLNTRKTNNDGRINTLWPENIKEKTGIYRVVFKTNDYFNSQQLTSFFPEIPIEFYINNLNEHYHIPLLLSQYGYSTYRGS